MIIKRDADGVTLHVELDYEKLLPCPFCGSANPEVKNTHTACYWVECTQCGAQVSGDSYPDPEKPISHSRAAMSAIDKWNKRA